MHNHLTALCLDYLGGLVPEETFIHSHPPWSSDILYQLPLSTAIHRILLVQFMYLTVLFHNLSSDPLWSSSWSGTLYFILLHENRNRCARNKWYQWSLESVLK